MTLYIQRDEVGTECPTCDRDFDDKRGMKIHHSKSHGEEIVEVDVCPICDEEFEVGQREEYCSRSCANEAKKNGVEKTCPSCGEDFWVRESMRDHYRFCSMECRQEGRTVTITCEQCGDAVEADKSQADRRKYCSKACRYEANGWEEWDDYRICEGCDCRFEPRGHEAKYCCQACFYEDRRSEDARPDTPEELLRELYAERDYSLHDTWKRYRIATGERVQKTDVRERLRDLGLFDPPDQFHRTVEDLDPEDVGLESADEPDGDDSWAQYYDGEADAA